MPLLNLHWLRGPSQRLDLHILNFDLQYITLFRPILALVLAFLAIDIHSQVQNHRSSLLVPVTSLFHVIIALMIVPMLVEPLAVGADVEVGVVDVAAAVGGGFRTTHNGWVCLLLLDGGRD